MRLRVVSKVHLLLSNSELGSFREPAFSAARCWDHDMTTYATTYGWRSTGVRRDLVTSPPEQKPVNGGRRGPREVYGIADPITTNQKVAGSSPAERAISFLPICKESADRSSLFSGSCSLHTITGTTTRLRRASKTSGRSGPWPHAACGGSCASRRPM